MESEDEADIGYQGKRWLQKGNMQQPSERRRIRDQYQELIDIAQKEKESDDFDADKIKHTMDQADTLFKEVCRPREAMFDATLLNIHGEIAKKKAHFIQTGTPFNADSFMRKLVDYLTGRHMDSGVVVNLEKETCFKLGNRVFRMYDRTPRLNFMNGIFTEPGETVRRQRQLNASDVKSKTTLAKVLDSRSQKANTDKTFEEMQRIKKIFSKMYEKKGGPVCYFKFTIDPDSFSRTIENMFHLSFLVKARTVLLSVDNNGLPVLEPVISDGGTARSSTSQSVLTMNMDKWKKLTEVFKIEKAAIPPPPHTSRLAVR